MKSRAQWQAKKQVAVALAREQVEKVINQGLAIYPGPKWLQLTMFNCTYNMAIWHLNLAESSFYMPDAPKVVHIKTTDQQTVEIDEDKEKQALNIKVKSGVFSEDTKNRGLYP